MRLVPHNLLNDPWEDYYGDILYLGDYLLPRYKNKYRPHSSDDMIWKGKEVLHLAYVNFNPIVALEKIGCTDLVDQLLHAKYDCPYTRRDYYWCVPSTILAKKGSKLYNAYANYFKGKWSEKMALDTEWNRHKADDKALYGSGSPKLTTTIYEIMLGLGYTEGTTVDDGCPSIENAIAYTDEGDVILFHTMLWHNK